MIIRAIANNTRTYLEIPDDWPAVHWYWALNAAGSRSAKLLDGPQRLLVVEQNCGDVLNIHLERAERGSGEFAPDIVGPVPGMGFTPPNPRLNPFGDGIPGSPSCSHWYRRHRWTAWSDVEEYRYVDRYNTRITRIGQRQRRTCTRCDEIDSRQVTP